MPDSLFELDIQRPAKGSRDASRLLHRQLKAAILTGRLAPGALLPPTRRSAQVFGVSRNTAIEVYETLVNDGLAVARHGSGTRVADAFPARARTPASGEGGDGRLNPFWLGPEARASIGFWRACVEDARVDTLRPALEFRPALIDARLFPNEDFRRLTARQLRSFERTPASYRSPQGNQGNHRLREAIARHIAVTRAVACDPTDILITAGAQQAFDILARALVVRPGSVVAVEDPGYPPMRVAFAAAGARVTPVPVDEEGLVVDRVPPQASIICLCPSHQFPLGVSMSPARRKALIAFARRNRAVIIEDDYDGEFRYGPRPLDALVSDDASDVVFYVGSLSKCMLPSLRLGFVVAPQWAMPSLTAVRNCLDWHSPTMVQASVAAFIAEGHLTRHVRKMRRIYGERRQLLLELLAGSLGAWLRPLPSFYGMHVAAVAREGLDVEGVCDRLLRRNIRLHTLSRYYLGPEDRKGIVFGFGVSDRQAILAMASALREACEDREAA
jgi:GntR family transcriptional regulator/MocR family aminotransferase